MSLPVPPRSRWVSAIGLRTSQQGDAGQGHRRTADGFRKEEGHRQSDKEKVRCHQEPPVRGAGGGAASLGCTGGQGPLQQGPLQREPSADFPETEARPWSQTGPFICK